MAVSINNPVHDPVWDRCQRIFTEWTDRLEMNWIHIALYRSDTVRSDDEGCAADTSAKWEYRRAKIAIYMPNVMNNTDEDLEDIIVHELVHVLAASMEQFVKEKDTALSEFAVETISRALICAHRSGYSEGLDKAIPVI